MPDVRNYSVRLLPLVLFLCLSALLLPSPPAAAAPDAPANRDAAGIALSVTPEAWAEADGSRAALVQKSLVRARESVVTGPTGKTQILFQDDTTLAVAPDSRVEIRDFVFTPTRNSFELGLNNGLVRMVSGEIVRRKPAAFGIRTPEAHVGVRGTTFAVSRRQGRTTAVLLETSGSGLEVTNLATGQTSRLTRVGYALEVTPGQTMQRPATPAEMNAARRAARRDAPVGLDTAPAAPLNLSPKGGKSPAGPADNEILLTESVAAAPLQDLGRNAGNASFGGSGNFSSGGQSGWWAAAMRVNLAAAVIEQANLHLTGSLGYHMASYASNGASSINSDGSFSLSMPYDPSDLGGSGQADMSGSFTSDDGGSLNWQVNAPSTSIDGINGSGSFGLTDLGPGVNNLSGSFAASGTATSNSNQSWNAGFDVGLGTAAISNAFLNIAGGAFNAAGGSGSIASGGAFNVEAFGNTSAGGQSAAMAGQFTSQSGGNLQWSADNVSGTPSGTATTGSGAFSKQ